MKCPICGQEFEAYPGMRATPPWCEPCQDEFDNIDWEKVREELGHIE